MATGISGFIFFIIGGLLNLIVLAMIISAVLSWLVAFNIINTRNPAITSILYGLDRFLAPILAPFRAVIPSVGGFDLSFIVAILVIQGMQRYLIPPAEAALSQLIG